MGHAFRVTAKKPPQAGYRKPTPDSTARAATAWGVRERHQAAACGDGTASAAKRSGRSAMACHCRPSGNDSSSPQAPTACLDVPKNAATSTSVVRPKDSLMCRFVMFMAVVNHCLPFPSTTIYGRRSILEWRNAGRTQPSPIARAFLRVFVITEPRRPAIQQIIFAFG